MKYEYAHIYLDSKTAGLLEEAIRITGVSKSKFVREALKEKFARMGLDVERK